MKKNFGLIGCLVSLMCLCSWKALGQDSLANMEIITTQKPYPACFTYLFKATEHKPTSFEQISQLAFAPVQIDTSKTYAVPVDIGSTIWVHTTLFSQLPTDKELLLYVGNAENIEV